MALVPVGAGYSSSSARRWKWKYDVFLSFRGEDTRTNFTDHLYTTLQRKGIITFRDNEGLKKGQFIKQNLLQAIEESFCAIVVLSQNYASSSWCLDELLKILDSRKKEYYFGLQVFPIFYEVDPCDVRHQKGSFAEAFRKHERRFTQDKVQKWKDALREVANLSGWHSKNQHEAELIESIAKQVWSKLQYRLSPDFNLVGIDSHIMNMDTLIAKELDDVRFIGIWGMGGIGKTTLARFVYERIKQDFEICCFLADVRDVCEREGLVHLQRKLISHLNLMIKINDDLYEGSMVIKHFLCNKKVLLVLDDVSNINQLENLAAMQEWFGLGSRVIITTREVHLLTSHGVFATYEMETLGYFDSLELFHQKAFRGSHPENQEYFELSKTIIRYANGLPLALKVLGLFLHGKTIHQWEDAINMLSKVVPKDILKVLKLSYDELEENEKTIFLNIACFFKGMDKDEVTQILRNCGLFAEIGIKVLIDKSLVTINSEGHLSMHDMLQEMGKNIVFQESPNDVGKRSRLWSWEDINHVLGKKKGTERIQWIVLKSFGPLEAHWDPEAFSNMCDLKLLIISGELNICHNLICFPQGLKVLQWDKYNLDALPHGVQFDELVDFKMQHSKIKQLWIETQQLEMLKFLDLSHCIDLIKTPNFNGIPNLETLILKGCTSLVEVDYSLVKLKKLKIVNLKDCASLKDLPGKLEMNSLETFILSGCSKIRKLPEFEETMELLSTLDLAETCIVKLPESIAYLTSLAILNLRNCKNLVCLPQVIQNLKSLETVNLSGCSKCESLPINWNENKGVKELDVSGTAIKDVPSSIFHLENLEFLSFMGCKKLVLPDFRPCLPLLKHLNLSYCNLNDESVPTDLSSLSSLKDLKLMGNNFVNLPATFISNLLKLKYLSMEHCPRLQSLPQLPPNVRSTSANDTASTEPFLDTQNLWDLFASLNLQHCGKPPDHIKLVVGGSEIPSWFHNQNDLHCPFPRHWNLTISLKDIPEYCRSSEWWGIATCVAVHGDSAIVPKLSHHSLSMSASLPQHGNGIVTLNFNLGQQYYSSHRLVILYSTCNSHEIATPIEFKFGIYNSLVRALDFSHQFQITKSGWRALCKQDIEAWRRQQPNQNSNHALFDLNVRPTIGDSEHATLLWPSSSSGSQAGRKRKRKRKTSLINFL